MNSVNDEIAKWNDINYVKEKYYEASDDYVELKRRINKAIEYINTKVQSTGNQIERLFDKYLFDYSIGEIEKILKGEDNE